LQAVLAYLIDEDEGSMSQKRWTPVDEAFREFRRHIDFGCEAGCEIGERLAEGAAVAIWPGERGRQRRADVSVG
jgi:hypothetical protein